MKDVGKYNSKEGLRIILNFVKINIHTNIVLLTVPHKYDLSIWSCINNEIKAFNRTVVKGIKCYKHVAILNQDQNSDLFTGHGFHFNKFEKYTD